MHRSLWLLVTALALTGCTPSTPNDGRIHVVFASGPDRGNYVHDRAAEFEALHPNVKIDMIAMPASTDTEHNQYATYLIAEDPTVDVYAIDVIWPAEFGAAGWAEPLESRVPASEQAKFLKGAIQSCQNNGHLWALPWYVDAGVLYYRKDLLDAAGLQPPQTWDDMVADCKKLQNPPDLYGYLGQWKQYEGLVCNFLEFIWGNGGDVLTPDGQVVVDSPDNVQALQEMYDWRNKDEITAPGINIYKEDESLNLFMAGKAIFLRQWPYCWALLQTSPNTHVAGKIAIAPLPHGPHGQSSATLGGWNLMVSRFSRHKDEAFAFVDFMTSAQTEKKMVIDASYMPTRVSVFSDPEVIAKLPVVSNFYKAFQGARPRPVTPFYSEVSDRLQSYISKAINGEETPAEALQEAQQDIASNPGLRAHVETTH